MQKIDKIHNYIADRMLAISPDERDEAEIRVIKEAKLEELQGILDIIGGVIKESREVKLNEDMEIKDVPAVVLGMGNKYMGTRIRNVLRHRTEFIYLKDLRQLRYNKMLVFRNMGPTGADILKAFCISQDLWEDLDHE